jgi:hypothetical protein
MPAPISTDLATWDSLFGVLPPELPYGARVFVVIMLVVHVLALLYWVLATVSGEGNTKRRRPVDRED